MRAHYTRARLTTNQAPVHTNAQVGKGLPKLRGGDVSAVVNIIVLHQTHTCVDGGLSPANAQ